MMRTVDVVASSESMIRLETAPLPHLLQIEGVVVYINQVAGCLEGRTGKLLRARPYLSLGMREGGSKGVAMFSRNLVL